MSLLKSFARKIVFPFAVTTGIEKTLSVFSAHKRLILMYHGVTKKTDFRLSVNHISVSDFEKHLQYIVKNFEVVSLKEIFHNYRQNEKSNELQVAITFDDGYENNFTNAFPLLKKYSLPATIFAVTKCLEQDNYVLWYDLLDILKSAIDINDFKQVSDLLPNGKRETLHKVTNIGQLKSFFKKLNAKEKDILLEKIIQQNKNTIENSNIEFRRMLTSDQMKEMISSGLIEIGSHTHNHPNLEELTDEEINFELKQSKKLLEEKTGQSVKSIAFPDGSYNDKIKRISKEAGYENMLAVDYKIAGDKNDKNILPRFCISNTTTPESNFIQIHLEFGKKGF